MTYFILNNQKVITTPVVNSQARPQERVFYLIKKEDVPVEDQRYILHLKCNSIRRIDGISRLLHYLDTHKCNNHHQINPYLLKRISWNEAVDIFGIQSETDTSESISDNSI